MTPTWCHPPAWGRIGRQPRTWRHGQSRCPSPTLDLGTCRTTYSRTAENGNKPQAYIYIFIIIMKMLLIISLQYSTFDNSFFYIIIYYIYIIQINLLHGCNAIVYSAINVQNDQCFWFHPAAVPTSRDQWLKARGILSNNFGFPWL